MWTWVDGHLLLVMAVCPVAAFLIVGWLNARLVRRCEQRAAILQRRGVR